MTERVGDEEEAAYVKGPFLGRIAHELRGPSGVISGALQELESALGNEAEKYRHLLAMADRGVKRVLRTAARLEETGMFVGGGPVYTRERRDLRELARESAKEAEAIEGRRKVAMSIVVPDAEAPVNVDAHWISMALTELVSNALRHARERVTVTVLATGDEVKFVCSDDQRQATPFEPLRFREPHERRGLGLGLALVSDIVRAHHGTLNIETGSTEFGARVTVALSRAGSSGGRQTS